MLSLHVGPVVCLTRITIPCIYSFLTLISNDGSNFLVLKHGWVPARPTGERGVWCRAVPGQVAVLAHVLRGCRSSIDFYPIIYQYLNTSN